MYHTYYFEAMAYYVLAKEEYNSAGEAGKGMGKAVGYLKATLAIFDKGKSVAA